MPRRVASNSFDLPRCSPTNPNKMDTMPRVGILQEQLIKPDYEPVGPSRKITLLLQRSVRYSYRQRCCKCLPTVICELLFPLLIIGILALSRYGLNNLGKEVDKKDGTIPGTNGQRPCSQDLNVPPTSSNEVFAQCFRFPPSYKAGRFTPGLIEVSNRTNLVFQPISNDTNNLVAQARLRLDTLGCSNAEVW